MNTTDTSGLRTRRLRNALLAGAVTLGIAGAGGAGALISNSPVAIAAPVEVEAATPADFSAVVEQVKPAVVSVQVVSAERVANRSLSEGLDNLPPEMREFFRRFGAPRGFGEDDGPGNRPDRRPDRNERGMAQGSGFFVSEDGYVVTNNHVVEDQKEITVIMDDGKELKAKLIGTDPRTDLALLKVEGNGYPYAKLAVGEAKIGQWVLAVGNPFGLGGTVTAGIISAQGRDIGSGPYDNFLQIDAPVNRGNSGGPTFNVKGEVVGVNTAIFSPSGGNVGIAFAIPAATVNDIVNDLRTEGSVTRGWLGVRIQPVTGDIAESIGLDGTDGAIVADAQPNSPAIAAGIKAGDVITKVNGEIVKDPKELSAKIAGFDPNQKVTVTVVRDGNDRDFSVTLGDLNKSDTTEMAAVEPDEDAQPDAAQANSLEGLGMTVERNPNGDGVVVTEVADDSSAARKGLNAGDVIVAIGSQPIRSVQDLEKGVSSAKDKGRGAVLFKVQGEQGVRFVGVPFEQG